MTDSVAVPAATIAELIRDVRGLTASVDKLAEHVANLNTSAAVQSERHEALVARVDKVEAKQDAQESLHQASRAEQSRKQGAVAGIGAVGGGGLVKLIEWITHLSTTPPGGQP